VCQDRPGRTRPDVRRLRDEPGRVLAGGRAACLLERCGTEASSRVIATRCRETSERRSPPAMIDKTYGHLLPDALERGRSALDALVGTLTAADGAAESTG